MVLYMFGQHKHKTNNHIKSRQESLTARLPVEKGVGFILIIVMENWHIKNQIVTLELFAIIPRINIFKDDITQNMLYNKHNLVQNENHLIKNQIVYKSCSSIRNSVWRWIDNIFIFCKDLNSTTSYKITPHVTK